MSLFYTARKVAARFGIHADHLWRQPSQRMMGLIDREIDLIVDVGANEGQFAREMRGIFPRAHIVSFEPQPHVHARLAAWARADGNATAINCAVGEAEAVLAMHMHVDHSPSSSLLPTSELEKEMFPETRVQRTVDVPVRRIDDVLAEIGRPANSRTFLKLDIQGFEEKALRGGPQTLRQVAALLSEVLIDPLYEGQADFLNIATMAREAGLRYAGNLSQHVARDGHVVFLDAMFLR